MLEIERKFLVDEIPNLSKYESNEIEQGYLSLTPEIRIRKKGDSYFITMKGDGSLTRLETETKIDEVTYEILKNLVKGNLIKKTRYKIPLEDNLLAELDIYGDNLEGLYTVEVEFKDEEQANNFDVPYFFGKDITLDKRFKNKNLSTCEDVKTLLESDKQLVLNK